MWTRFMDMHSGGSSKEKQQYIYIEADEEKAKIIFYNKFGHNPERVTCTCCGEDYSISSDKSLRNLTGYDRHCHYENGKYVERKDHGRFSMGRDLIKLKDYLLQEDVLVIRKSEISPEDMVGCLPIQGYVWVD